MEKKQKIILISVLFVLAIIILLIVLNLLKKAPKVVDTVQNNNVTQNEIIAKPITQVQNERNEIINTARGFVEIYGTFTNTNDYQNMKDLYPFMTDKLIKKYDAIIAAYVRSDNFYSKTTQVLSVNLPSYKNDDKVASATVSVVEKVIDSAYKESVSKKTYTVSLRKDDEKWKVDEIK